MKTSLTTEEKQFLEDALARLREGELLINQGKIIRPAYKAVKKNQPYVPMDER